jgi:ribosomal protein L11
MTLTIHKNGTATLHADTGDLALLLTDAAKSMTGKNEPLKEDVTRLADQISQHAELWTPDSSLALLGKDVREAMSK